MEVLDRFTWEGHTAHGIKSNTFFDDGTDIIDFLFIDRILPCRIAISIVGVEDSFIGRMLESLTLYSGKTSDDGCQCTGDGLETSRHETETDTSNLDCQSAGYESRIPSFNLSLSPLIIALAMHGLSVPASIIAFTWSSR